MGPRSALAEDEEEFMPLTTDLRSPPPLPFARAAELALEAVLRSCPEPCATSRVDEASRAEVLPALAALASGVAVCRVDFVSSAVLACVLFSVMAPSAAAADDDIPEEGARTDFESPVPFDVLFWCIAERAAADDEVAPCLADGASTDLASLPLRADDFCCKPASAAAADDVDCCADGARTDLPSLAFRVDFCMAASAAAADDVAPAFVEGARTDLTSLPARAGFRSFEAVFVAMPALGVILACSSAACWSYA